MVVGVEGGKAISRIYDLRDQNNVRGWPPPKVDSDEYVIGLPDGTPIKKYLRSLFYKLLKAAGMLTDTMGQKRSIYCCRHTFPRNQLNNGVNVYWLKDQMGTSVAMLEKFYWGYQGIRRGRQPRGIEGADIAPFRAECGRCGVA